MIDEKEIEIFLVHHGVKGQHWGIRNLENSKVGGGLKSAFKKAPKGDWKTRSKAQKLGLLTTGFLGATVTTPIDAVISKAFKNNAPIRVILGTAATIVTSKLAVRFTRNVLQTNGKKKLKDIAVNKNDSVGGRKTKFKNKPLVKKFLNSQFIIA